MFMVALLVKTPNWNQVRYFSVGEWIHKLVYPYKEILFSDQKK